MAKPMAGVIVSLRSVTVEFGREDRLGHKWASVRALDQVNLDLYSGTRVGIAGSSGSGKSTLARCVAGWLHPTSGEIERRAETQLVMQDPGASLNPRFTAFEIVEEPLRIARLPDRKHRVDELLQLVGILPAEGRRRAGEFSGGERARLAIARALAAMPEGGLLILDESLSSLDWETRDNIMALLDQLHKALDLTLVLVSHELSMLAGFADVLLILHHGRIIEAGAPQNLLSLPQHPHTQLLISSTLRKEEQSL